MSPRELEPQYIFWEMGLHGSTDHGQPNSSFTENVASGERKIRISCADITMRLENRRKLKRESERELLGFSVVARTELSVEYFSF